MRDEEGFKIVKVAEIPTCDFCKEKPGIFDAPTFLGSWANMCEDCFPNKCDTIAAKAVGTKRVLQGETPVQQAKIVYAVEETSMEDVVMGGEMREVSCPECGECRNVEEDATYKYICEGCGVNVQVKDIMESAF